MKTHSVLTICTLALLSLFFCSCTTDDTYDSFYYNEPTIYSGSDDTRFSEIIFFLQPYIKEGETKVYPAVSSLRNIMLTINGKIEKSGDSFSIDVNKLNNTKAGDGFLLSTAPILYPTIITVSMIPEELDTAGDYADILNDFLTLKPGTYICQIHSFDIQLNSGELRTYYTPTLSIPLEVRENMYSANLGVFEAELY